MSRKKLIRPGNKLLLKRTAAERKHEEPPLTIKIEDAKTAKLIGDHAVKLAECAAQSLAIAEQRRITTTPISQFSLHQAERAVLTTLSAVPEKLKNKLAQQEAQLTVADVGGLTMAVADSLPEAEPIQQLALLSIAEGLLDCLQKRLVGPERLASC